MFSNGWPEKFSTSITSSLLLAPFGRSHIFCSFSDADNSNSIIKDFLMSVIYFETFFLLHFLGIINNTINCTRCPITEGVILLMYHFSPKSSKTMIFKPKVCFFALIHTSKPKTIFDWKTYHFWRFWLNNSTPEPRYSKRAHQTPFVYYIKSFTISRYSKKQNDD